MKRYSVFPLIAFAIGSMLIALAPTALKEIHRWEKANNYPYGKMCHSIFTGYQDTCKPQYDLVKYKPNYQR